MPARRIVRDVNEAARDIARALAKTEAFAQSTGIVGDVTVLEYDRATKMVSTVTVDVSLAGIRLLEELSTLAGAVADFIPRAEAGTADERRVLAEHVLPELKRSPCFA